MPSRLRSTSRTKYRMTSEYSRNRASYDFSESSDEDDGYARSARSGSHSYRPRKTPVNNFVSVHTGNNHFYRDGTYNNGLCSDRQEHSRPQANDYRDNHSDVEYRPYFQQVNSDRNRRKPKEDASGRRPSERETQNENVNVSTWWEGFQERSKIRKESRPRDELSLDLSIAECNRELEQLEFNLQAMRLKSRSQTRSVGLKDRFYEISK